MDLTGATLVSTNFKDADLTGCRVFGTSTWDIRLEGAKQTELVITCENESAITVDNLEVAQFIYLLLKNEKIRHVIDTITSKVALILGRFPEERKAVLDALRKKLRKRDYSPIVFDFEKSESRNQTETVSTLAHIASFVIADITDAWSIPQELQKIVPNLPSVPVQPLILKSDSAYGMFKDFDGYQSVLPLYRYENQKQLLASLDEQIIAPPLNKAREIEERRKQFERRILAD